MKELIIIFTVIRLIFSQPSSLPLTTIEEDLMNIDLNSITAQENLKVNLFNYSTTVQSCVDHLKSVKVTKSLKSALEQFSNSLDKFETVDEFPPFENISICSDIDNEIKVIASDFQNCVDTRVTSAKNLSDLAVKYSQVYSQYAANIQNLGGIYSTNERMVWNVILKYRDTVQVFHDFITFLGIIASKLDYYEKILTIYKDSYCPMGSKTTTTTALVTTEQPTTTEEPTTTQKPAGTTRKTTTKKTTTKKPTTTSTTSTSTTSTTSTTTSTTTTPTSTTSTTTSTTTTPTTTTTSTTTSTTTTPTTTRTSTTTSTTTQASCTPPITLKPGECLTAGTKNASLFTCNKCYEVRMQSDGNFAAYTKAGTLYFATFTTGSGATTACMQTDGNFVVKGSWSWQTYSSYAPGARFVFSEDGTLAVMLNDIYVFKYLAIPCNA